MPRSHANRGKPLEAALDLIHKRYQISGRVTVHRQRPEVAFGSGKPREKGPPDFIVIDAVYVWLVDAKSTSKDVLNMSDLPIHQLDAFTRHEALGPTRQAGIILHLAGVVFWVPWSALRPVWETWRAARAASASGRAAKGEGSIGVSWLVKHAHRVSGYDWLPVASVAVMS